MTQLRDWGPGGAAATAAFLVLAAYLSFAAIRGENGLFVRSGIEAEIVRLANERDAARTDVEDLRRRVAGLSDGTLDLEFVDERIRDVLGYVRRNEIVLR